MRVKIMTVFVGAVCLLATGCGSEGGQDDTKPKLAGPLLPQKVTEPKSVPDLEPSASPSADATFAENVAYELEGKTIDMAGFGGETVGRCPDDLGSKAGTTAVCTVAYEGIKVEWDVTIGEKGWSDNIVEYQASPRQGILARDGLARLMFGNNSDLDYALCNDIPKAVLVPLGETTYKCEEVFKGKEPFGYTQPVRVTDAGPRIY